MTSSDAFALEPKGFHAASLETETTVLVFSGLSLLFDNLTSWFKYFVLYVCGFYLEWSRRRYSTFVF